MIRAAKTLEMPRRTLITGHSKGIGLAVARKMRDQGVYDLYGIARSRPSSPDDASICSVACDLADADATTRALDQILERSGGLDVLVLNAGMGVFKDVRDLNIHEWQHVIAVGLTANFVIVNRALPLMMDQDYGRIVVISSDADDIAFASASAYCATKAGLSSFANCVRKEVAGFDIHVTLISPGRVDTYFNHKVPGTRPLSLHADHVADQILFVVSQPSRCEIEHIRLNASTEKLLH